MVAQIAPQNFPIPLPPDIVTTLIDPIMERGISGAFILLLLFAVFKLYNRNQELHTTLYETGRESVKANEAMSAALNRLTDLLLRGRLSE